MIAGAGRRPLRISNPFAMRMKVMTVAALILLASCAHRKQAACPPIDQLAQRDARADATAAAERGDNRLVMVAGYVGELPGGLEPSQVRVLEGTAVKTAICVKRRPIAFRYARLYNRVMLKSQLRRG